MVLHSRVGKGMVCHIIEEASGEREGQMREAFKSGLRARCSGSHL